MWSFPPSIRAENNDGDEMLSKASPLHLGVGWPYLQFVVQEACWEMATPSECDVKRVKGVARYLEPALWS